MIFTSLGAPRTATAFIFVTVAINALSFGMIFPVLPGLIVEFAGDTGRGAMMLGLFGTTWAAMQFFAAPFLGVLSDRYGRRPVILLSSFGLGLDFILMAMAPSLSWLLAGRVISGITSATGPTAAAYITDVTPPARRAANFGMLGAAMGVGLVVGPAFGGVLGSINLRLPFCAAAVLTLATLLYGFFRLPESLPPERRAGFAWKEANPVSSLRLLCSKRTLFAFSMVNFLNQLANGVIGVVTALYLAYRYQWGADKVGLVLTVIGVSVAAVQGVLLPWVIRRIGERAGMLVGLCCGSVGLLGYALAPTGAWFLAVLPLTALCGLAGPAVQNAMTRHVSTVEQGRLQGANASLGSVAGMVAPPLFAATFAWFIEPGHPVHPGAPFVLAALLMLVSAALAFLVTFKSSAEACGHRIEQRD